jgi:hypothetical protein
MDLIFLAVLISYLIFGGVMVIGVFLWLILKWLERSLD